MSLPPAVETSGNFQRAAEISCIFLWLWRFCIYKDIAKDRDTVLCYKVDVEFPCSSLLLPLPSSSLVFHTQLTNCLSHAHLVWCAGSSLRSGLFLLQKSAHTVTPFPSPLESQLLFLALHTLSTWLQLPTFLQCTSVTWVIFVTWSGCWAQQQLLTGSSAT